MTTLHDAITELETAFHKVLDHLRGLVSADATQLGHDGEKAAAPLIAEAKQDLANLATAATTAPAAPASDTPASAPPAEAAPAVTPTADTPVDTATGPAPTA